MLGQGNAFGSCSLRGTQVQACTFLAVQNRAAVRRPSRNARLLLQRLLPAQALRGVPGVLVALVTEVQSTWACQTGSCICCAMRHACLQCLCALCSFGTAVCSVAPSLTCHSLERRNVRGSAACKLPWHQCSHQARGWSATQTKGHSRLSARPPTCKPEDHLEELLHTLCHLIFPTTR